MVITSHGGPPAAVGTLTDAVLW